MLPQDEAFARFDAIDAGDYTGQIERAIWSEVDRDAALEAAYERFIADCRRTVDDRGVDLWTKLEAEGVTGEHLEAWLEGVWDQKADDMD